MADLEGVQGVRSNPPLDQLLLFHGEFQDILCGIRHTNPPFIHLNPLLINPGSAPAGYLLSPESGHITVTV